MKNKVYPCPKCRARGDVNPPQPVLVCPQCGHTYRKVDSTAQVIK